MILGTLLRSLGYLLDLGAYLIITLLFLEWLVHYLPGVGLNPLRRFLFKTAYPFLRFSDLYLPVSLGSFHLRGLIMALAFWAVAKSLLPWVVWAGFALRG